MRELYLAGNIGNLSAEECTKRFNEGKEKLEKLGFIVRSPIRGKVLTSLEMVEKEEYIYEPGEIVIRDLWDIDRAELVVAMPMDGSIGTFMEIFYAAHIKHIPVIVVAESSRIKLHYWIRFLAAKIVPNLDEAINYIQRWYL